MSNMNVNLIVTASKGNPGAATAIMQMVQFGKSEQAEKAISYGIVGTDFYVLFSDLCGRDPFIAGNLIDKCPKDVLIDACSRQDYSGRELVKNYF